MNQRNESLDDLRARSKAIRESSRQTLDEASEHEQALTQTLDRSADHNARVDAQKSWPNTPTEG